MSANIRRFNNGSVELVCSEWGDPRAQGVMLAHGAGQTRHTWNRLAHALEAKGYYVLSIDLRGHGDTSWSPEGDYSSDAFMSDLRHIAAQLNQPPIMVGASLGGLMSLLSEGESATPVASALVLVDIVPNLNEAGKARIVEFMSANHAGFANTDEAADAIAAYLPHRPKPKDSSGLLRNLRLRDDGRYYWHWDPAFFEDENSTSHDPITRYVRGAENIRIPTLLLRGEHSDLVPEAAAKQLLDYIPHAQYVDISDAHHMIVGDNNDAFADAVLAFLDELKLSSAVLNTAPN